MADILVQGLTQNNLKHISFCIPKEKITVFTGLSGSGKSSIVFDTIAAESQRQMNATYPPFVRQRLPKYPKPAVESIENLTPSVIVDQSSLGGNARSTVGTASGLYASLRLLFSRIGQPFVGTASYFSFNDPNGMCKTCSGIGKVTKVDVDALIDPEKSWNQGCVKDSLCLHNLKHVDVDIPLGIMTVVTGVAGSGKSTLVAQVFAKIYGDQVVMVDQGPITATNRSTPASYLGFFDKIRKLLAKENGKPDALFSFNSDGACPVCGGKGVIVTELAFMDPIVTECEACGGVRYNQEALVCTYKGKNIVELLNLTASQALNLFDSPKIKKHLRVMQQVGLGYLTLGQPLSTLSGGERQRLKLAKNLDKKGSIFIMDEPTTGLHMSDIENLLMLFDAIVSRGNTLVVIEHNLDVMKQADWIIDIGPDGGKNGGEVVFTGTPMEMIQSAKTLTADSLRSSCTISGSL